MLNNNSVFLTSHAWHMTFKQNAIFSDYTDLDVLVANCRRFHKPPIPKGAPSSSVANYRPISLTPLPSKIFDCLVSIRLGGSCHIGGDV